MPTFEFYGQIKWFINTFNNWTYYFDVYHPAYTEMYLKFNSWNELFNLINNNVNSSLKDNYLDRIKIQMIDKFISSGDLFYRLCVFD